MENVVALENEAESRIGEEKYVVFKLQDEYYGIDINNVKSIEKAQDFTRIPNADDYIKGVINLRGEVVPVVDLRKRLGLEQQEENHHSRIIIVVASELQIGLLVDRSSEVVTFSESEIDCAQSIKESDVGGFIKHIGKKDGRLVILIDLEKVIGVA